MSKFKVWTCKIVVNSNEKLPNGFDFPPRRASINAIENKGIKVLSCFSGWGGKLTKSEEDTLETFYESI